MPRAAKVSYWIVAVPSLNTRPCEKVEATMFQLLDGMKMGASNRDKLKRDQNLIHSAGKQGIPVKKAKSDYQPAT